MPYRHHYNFDEPDDGEPSFSLPLVIIVGIFCLFFLLVCWKEEERAQNQHEVVLPYQLPPH